jgi:protein-L-isoaspartate(D-aspartate) O-methyltransferase
VIPDLRPDLAMATPDADPRWLYHDMLVSIDAARQLNNGVPSLWARLLDRLDVGRGARVLQVGAGTGYYSAVLAELVGPDGRVIAVEHDGDLAARARGHLAAWPQVDAVAGDGRTHDPGEVDVVVVFAGSTHPAPLWLDRLAEGGRLLMPLTGANRWGISLLVTREGAGFRAQALGWIGIYPCTGGRDGAAAARLGAALEPLDRDPAPVRRLHRGEPPADAGDRVWYQAPGCWLER